MAAIDPGGDEKYWIDGVSFQGIRNQQVPNGDETYSFEAKSEENLFPPNNADTGKFLLLFE